MSRVWTGAGGQRQPAARVTEPGTATGDLGPAVWGLPEAKIHIGVDALGNPVRFSLTAGQRHDITQAEALLADDQVDYVIGDKSYDDDDFILLIQSRGAVPVIPPRANRKKLRAYDEPLYRERQLVECFINKIKWYRRSFSRFEKLASRYLGFLSFVGDLIWLR